MRINENLRIRPESHELAQHLAYVSPLGRSCVELPVGERSCATLAVAVVRVWIQHALLRKFRHVEFALMHVLSSFQDNWLASKRQKFQSSENASRAGSDDYHRLSLMHVFIFRNLVWVIRLAPIIINFYLIAVNDLVPSIYRAFRNHAGIIRIRELRLERFSRIDNIDYGVSTEHQLPCSHNPNVVRPQVSPYAAGHFKLFHILKISYS